MAPVEIIPTHRGLSLPRLPGRCSASMASGATKRRGRGQRMPTAAPRAPEQRTTGERPAL
jgi:hypothetical protein